MGRTNLQANDNYTKLEDIYRVTDNGVDIFKKYVNLRRKAGRWIGQCPTGSHVDNHPSFNVSDAGNGVCFSCGWKGDATDLVMMREHVDLPTAVKMIAQDFKVSEKPVPVQTKEVLIPELCTIDFVPIPFKKVHHKYWNVGHLQEDFLKAINIFATERWAINGKVQRLEPGQYCFAYWDQENNYTKVLSLGVAKQNKWRTDSPKSFLWNYPKEPVKDLFIEKSVKDNALNLLLGHPGTAVNSENAENLIENMPRILEKCPNPIISFGSDPIDDAKADKVIAQYPQVRKFTIPKNLLRFGCNDKFQYSKVFGLEALNNLIKRQTNQ